MKAESHLAVDLARVAVMKTSKCKAVIEQHTLVGGVEDIGGDGRVLPKAPAYGGFGVQDDDRLGCESTLDAKWDTPGGTEADRKLDRRLLGSAGLQAELPIPGDGGEHQRSFHPG